MFYGQLDSQSGGYGAWREVLGAMGSVRRFGGS